MKQTATITRFIHQIIQAAREHVESGGYTEVITPRIVKASGACENVDTLFEVSVDKDHGWFGRPAYLSQTGQLYLEALVPALEKVYCVGSSFRAEPKVDDRHLIEFQLLEIESAGGFEQLLVEIEGVIKAMLCRVLIRQGTDQPFISPLAATTKLESKFPRLTYDQAIEELKNMGEQIEWGNDISSKREQMLVQRFGQQPLFITHFPDPMHDFGKEIEVEKFFNMLPDSATPGRVLSCDLILPYSGESVGAAARVHDPDEMVKRLKNSRMFKRLKSRGGSIEDFAWYIETVKKHGSVPHAGCGFGLSRITQWMLGGNTIIENVSFPTNRAHII